jgi:hypothetical protein
MCIDVDKKATRGLDIGGSYASNHDFGERKVHITRMAIYLNVQESI